MQAKALGRVSWLTWFGLVAGLGLLAGCSFDEQDAAEAPDEQLAEGASSISTLANYVVTVHKTGSSGGYVYSTPAGISCSSPCSASFPEGTVLTLTAEPAPQAIFGGWSGGGCSGTSTTCTFIVEGDTDIGANFQMKFHTLTVGKVGYGAGTVTSSPGGINCGSSCSTSVPHGYSFSLTATPAAGSLFLGWSGACSGTGSCFVSMTQAQNVTATFVQANPVVTVWKTGSSGGSIASSPGYISCGAPCSAAIPYGTVLTLAASPAPQAIFGGWSGAGCSGTGLTCTFTVTRDVTLSANFQMKFLTLSVSKSGAGTVTSSPSGINCGSACSASVPYGNGFTLTATPALGSTFVGWGGACSGTGSCYVSMTEARAVTATFSP